MIFLQKKTSVEKIIPEKHFCLTNSEFSSLMLCKKNDDQSVQKILGTLILFLKVMIMRAVKMTSENLNSVKREHMLEEYFRNLTLTYCTCSVSSYVQ